MSTLKPIIYTLILLSLVSCSGKSTSEFFFRDDIDLGYVTTIAVLPFENNSKDKYASERLRDITITKILALKNFDVVDKGIVDNQLKNEAITLSGDNLDIQTMERIGQLINCQALLLGTVDSAGDKRRGSVSYHQLTITLRLIDSSTGTILWHGTGSRNGDSFGSRIFGITPDDEFGVAFKLLDELIRTIPLKGVVKQNMLEQERFDEPIPGVDGNDDSVDNGDGSGEIIENGAD